MNPPPTMQYANNILTEGKNNLNNAILKFALLLNENPDKDTIKFITNRLKTLVSPDDLKRIIELADELDEKPEDDFKPSLEDENQPKDEESKDGESSKEKD